MDRSVKVFGIQAAAALCIYLVFSLTTASAVEIAVYRQVMGGSGPVQSGQPLEFSMDYSAIIDKKFEIVHDESDTRWENVQVKINVTGKDMKYPISRIYLFKCKDTNPRDCTDYEPVEAVDKLTGEKGTFYWKDVSRNAQANFLTLVKFRNEDYDTDSWIGYWDSAKRTGVQGFTKESREISKIEIYADVGKDPEWVKSFILRHYMIPANWIDRAVIGPVDGTQTAQMHLLLANASDMENTKFLPFLVDKNYVESTTRDYMFAFPANVVPNPVTFFANPAPDCGDGQCDIGETPELCCLDCGCASESQECTATPSYPNGRCHVCGDGVPDPVENWTNCCADAGCAGKASDAYCDTSGSTAGFCKTPMCPNNVCEPTEDSGNCAPDCFDVEGKTCADVFGDNYYYENQKCIPAVCPNNKCEAAGGETFQNCCADCNSCPSGQYCNKDTLAGGVCTAPTCSFNNPSANPKCEALETQASCCTDCGCGGNLICESNVCHLCGNGINEAPVETTSNCCQDTNCPSGNYCSLENSCKPESEMGFTASMLPNDIDCERQDSLVEVKFTPQNAPMDTEYQRVTYIFENSMYTLSGCTRLGDVYSCPFPINGSSSFRGCYGSAGPKDVTFTVSFKYYEDGDAKKANAPKYKDVSVPMTINVANTREWSCTKDRTCSSGMGENRVSCCYDCGCDAGTFCASSGCLDESSMGLSIVSVPDRNSIDCAGDPNGDFTFTAMVENAPENKDDSFRIASAKLEYGGKNYTTSDIGFSCVPEKGDDGFHTGLVDCTVPIAYFPACKDATEQAGIKLHLNILGGGLSGKYPQTGLPLSSDAASFTYKSGLPLCGDGKPNPELGETDQNCCQDITCSSADSVCTTDGSCHPLSDIGLNVKIDPAISCSLETDADRQNKKVKLEITMKNGLRPYTKNSGVMKLGSVYLDGIRIEEMQGKLTESNADGNGWVYEIPVYEFVPYCYEGGLHASSGPYDAVNFVSSISWKDKDGKSVEKDVEEDVSFTIVPRARECNANKRCEPRLGETTDNCCWDCGCAGGQVCTRDSESDCVAKEEIAITATASPQDLYCDALSEDDNLIIDIDFQNHPYDVDYTKWYIEYKDAYGNWEDLNQMHYDCTADVDLFNDETGSYTCEIPLYHFPPCATEGEGLLRVTARMLQTDNTGKRSKIEPNDTVAVNVRETGVPLCGVNGRCDPGETKTNCCQDCGCPSGDADVCTEKGDCVDDKDFKLMVTSTKNPTIACQMTAGTVDMENYAIRDYGCMFQDPLEVEVSLTPMPANAVVRSGSATYTWTRDVLGEKKKDVYKDVIPEEIAGGWKLGLMLNPDAKFRINDDDSMATQVSDITLTVESRTTAGDTKVVKVKSADVVNAIVDPKKNDDLLSYEQALADMAKAMEKANRLTCTVTSILATCVVCSLMAGGKDAEVPGAVKNENDGILDFLTKKKKVEKMSDKLIELESEDIDVISGAGSPAATPGATSTNLGGIRTNLGGAGSQGIFSNLMDITADGSKGSSLLVGAFAGGLLMYVESSMLDCSGGFITYLAAATGACMLMKQYAPQTLPKIVKVCDQLTTALSLVRTVTSLQRSTMSYNMCMVAAEQEMTKAQSTTQTGYDAAMRTSNYYTKTAACTDASTTSMTKIITDLSEATTNAMQYTGGSAAGVSITPASGSKVGPGGQYSSIDMSYSFAALSTNNYGTIAITATYVYTLADGTTQVQADSVRSCTIPIRTRQGTARCEAGPSGMQCIDHTGGTTCYDMFARCTRAECGNAPKLSGGKITVSYTPQIQTNTQTGGTAIYDYKPSTASGSSPSSDDTQNSGTTAAAPAITTQPQPLTVTAGQSATFSAAASGTPAPAYQWRKDGTNINGANGATYTISNAQAGDAGAYSVTATNSAGSVTSGDATLTVSAAAVSGHFSAGQKVKVTVDTLNVRETAGTGGAIKDGVLKNAEGTIQEGPVIADGYEWYKVQWTAGSLLGWSVLYQTEPGTPYAEVVTS